MKNYTCSTTKIHPCGVHMASKPKPKRARKNLTAGEVSHLQTAYIKAVSRICDTDPSQRGENFTCGRLRVCWGWFGTHGMVTVIERGGDRLLRVMTGRRGKPVSMNLYTVTAMSLSVLRAVVDIIEEV